MDRKKKQQVFAVIVGVIMLASTAGFALFSSVSRFGGTSQDGQGNQNPSVPAIVQRPLTTQETLFVLQSGKALIQYRSPAECQECDGEKAILEGFVQQFSGSAVLEETAGNKSVEITTYRGELLDLSNETITGENLLKLLCISSAVQPRECLFVDL
ncbi:MAG: hypothetical protein HY518_04395 [Candidatus Aenigmarchaeota archaeon]|nr:hypothetical protein [Candidatus Aenigmarchaeota archaeon]